MEIKIEMMLEDEDGIHIQGLIPLPQRGEVPTLGVLESKTEVQRKDRLHRWTEESKEVSKKFSAATYEYRKVHLGFAKLTQEDVEE